MTGVTSLAPPPPEVAREVFGAALPAAVRYAELLAGTGIERGLIGPREVPRLWVRHLLNCAAVAPLVPAGLVVDLGSGAGLPGIVLALVRTDLRVLLLDATRRRTDFLSETLTALGLAERVEVRWVRAEAVTDVAADAVVARAVAPLDRLVRWAVPLLRPGGELLAMKGANAEEELAEHRVAVRRAGLVVDGVEVCSLPGVEPTYVIRGHRP